MKFLQQECPEYPVYAFTSELSKAFNDIDGIDTVVDLSEYANQINQRIRKSNKTKELEKYANRESLVTSTQEFIKNIIRDTFKKYNKTKIKPRDWRKDISRQMSLAFLVLCAHTEDDEEEDDENDALDMLFAVAEVADVAPDESAADAEAKPTQIDPVEEIDK